MSGWNQDFESIFDFRFFDFLTLTCWFVLKILYYLEISISTLKKKNQEEKIVSSKFYFASIGRVKKIRIFSRMSSTTAIVIAPKGLFPGSKRNTRVSGSWVLERYGIYIFHSLYGRRRSIWAAYTHFQIKRNFLGGVHTS